MQCCLCFCLAYIWFACDFGWADNPSYCGWSQEGGEGAEWHINNNSKHADHKLPNLTTQVRDGLNLDE